MDIIITKILQEALPFIAVASIGFFILILLIRIVAKIVFFLIPLFFIKQYQAYKALKFQKKQLKDPDPLYEPNDNLEFRRDLEKEVSLGQHLGLMNVHRINEIQPEGISTGIDRKNIVGVTKPVGKWTSLLLGQKLSLMVQHAQIMSEDPDRGFWVSMLEARERTPDFHRGRGV